MAIVCTNVTSTMDESGDGTTVISGVILEVNTLYLITIAQRRGDTTDPVVPTVASLGATWELVDPALVSANSSIVYDSTSASRRRITVLRTMVTTAASGDITVTHGSNVTDATIIIDKATGVDTAGANGVGSIVQAVAAKDETGTATSLSVTLAAFKSTRHGTYGSFGWAGNPTMTAGTGFTELDEQHDSVSDIGCGTEWRADNDTGVDMTLSVADFIGGVAVELRAEATTNYLKERYHNRGDMSGVSLG